MKGIIFAQLLFISQTLMAHNMDVVTRVENGELVVQVWMGEDPGEEVEISIYNSEGEMRFNGQTNSEGIMHWQPMAEEALSISVYAEAGHETEIALTADQMKEIISSGGNVSASSQSNSSQSSSIQAESTSSQELTSTLKNRQPLVNILAGLGFILSLAAVWMAFRNQKRMAILEKEWQNRER